MSRVGERPEALRPPAAEERRRRELEAREGKREQREQRARAEAEEQRRRHEQRAESDRAEREAQLQRRHERERRRARARARAEAGGMVGAVAVSPSPQGAAAGRAATPNAPPPAPGPAAGTPAATAPVGSGHATPGAARSGDGSAPPPSLPPRGPGAGAAPSPERPSLKRPTAKVAGALALAAACAVGAGYLLGLPLPLLGDDAVKAEPAGAKEPIAISPGTPVGLSKGPFHPVVVENPDYGEAAAKFGADRGGRKHEGQDIFARPGTPLVAVRDGIVLDGGGGRSFYSYGGGNTFVMYSPMDDRSYVYLHMRRPALVRAGERVKAGQLIGRVGCTGSCDGPHLHFEVRLGRAVYGPQKKPIDPLPLLRRWPLRPTG